MNELFCTLLATLDSLVPGTVTFLLGFISAYLLFEFTEWRREQRARQELRRALVVELEVTEALASSIVPKYARFFHSKEDVASVAREIRWFVEIGRLRMKAVGILSDLSDVTSQLVSLSDDQLVILYSKTHETVGVKLIMPVLDRTLAGQTFGFSVNQIQALSVVRWQMHLLAQDADSMHEMWQLSFTVTDENNHKTVLENHDQRSVAYARRAQTLLRVIRKALELLR